MIAGSLPHGLILLAHGIGGRADLPVPVWLAALGAGAAVIASFVVLTLVSKEPRLRPRPPQTPGRETVASTILRAVVLVLFLLSLVIAGLGAGDPDVNPVPTWFYAWFWVGLVVVPIVFGPVWRAVNPLRSVVNALLAISRSDEEFLEPVPEKAGYLPAALGLFAFVWLELVFTYRAEPIVILVFIAAYSLVQIGAGLRYGLGWFDRGDGFEVYSVLMGSMSPASREDGRFTLIDPLRGPVSLNGARGLSFVIFVLLGSTAFDGLSRTTLWFNLTFNLNAPVPSMVIGSVALIVCIAIVWISFNVACSVAASAFLEPGDNRKRADLVNVFSTSLIPIAAGYAIAHYFSFLVFQGQAGYILANDPFSLGWNLLGLKGWEISYGVVSTRLISVVQVGAIVMGHIAGAVIAHDQAMQVFPREKRTWGQLPLLIVMVFYTIGGIALVLGG